MDLEQLLLAWKLKTNQEVTKSDIEKVFLSLDLSKFKNGETISLADIFKLMNASEASLTTHAPPTTYDEYTEEDVPFDPFFKDVPKVGTRAKRQSQLHVVPVKENGRFKSHETRRRAKGQGSPTISIADIEVLTGAVRGHGHLNNSDFDSDSRKEIVIKRESKEPKREVISNARVVEEEEESRPRRGRGRGGVKFKPSPDDLPQPDRVRPIPQTGFNCKGKIAGGFYADTEVDCQLFHICTDAGDGS